MEFQIKKNAMSLLDQAAHQRRAFSREQLIANFQPANAAPKAGGKLDGVDRVVHVERD
jgi:hypothetical protein